MYHPHFFSSASCVTCRTSALLCYHRRHRSTLLQDDTMPYSAFNLSKVKTDFKLIFVENQDLFGDVQAVSPSEYLNLIFSEHLPLVTAINTEKARSELIIMPVLIEVKRFFKYQISIFSGSEFKRLFEKCQLEPKMQLREAIASPRTLIISFNFSIARVVKHTLDDFSNIL